jgi:hypothetical protein
MKGTVKRTWNLPQELAESLELEAKRRRTTVTSVLHGILGRALATKDPLEETLAIEARIAATLDRQGREIERLQRSQQVALALIDGLTKALLLRLEDPPAERLRERRAQAQVTYEKLLKNVGRELKLETGAVGLLESEDGEAPRSAASPPSCASNGTHA